MLTLFQPGFFYNLCPLHIFDSKTFLAFLPFWPFRTIHYLEYPTIRSHPSSNLQFISFRENPILDSLSKMILFRKSAVNRSKMVRLAWIFYSSRFFLQQYIFEFSCVAFPFGFFFENFQKISKKINFAFFLFPGHVELKKKVSFLRGISAEKQKSYSKNADRGAICPPG